MNTFKNRKQTSDSMSRCATALMALAHSFEQGREADANFYGGGEEVSYNMQVAAEELICTEYGYKNAEDFNEVLHANVCPRWLHVHLNW